MVQGVRWTGNNFAELREFTGRRLVDVGVSVPCFNLIGTYLATFEYHNNAGELYLTHLQLLVPVHVGDWVVRFSEGFSVVPSNDDGTAPVNYVAGVGTNVEALIDALTQQYRNNLSAALQPYL
jgi:hypothetical protein